MILPDVNVLLYALQADDPRHPVYATWLRGVTNGSEELALHDVVLAGVLRISTNPRIYPSPAPAGVALDFVERLIDSPRARWVSGRSSWVALRTLVDGDRQIAGDLVPAALLAATAIAYGARLATADRGFGRFPGLRFFDPAA